MVNKCAVPGCPTKATDLDISFHKAPRHPLLFEQWNSSIRWDQYGGQLCSTMYICSAHFQDSDYWVSSKGIRFLKRFAVPTVFDMCIDPTEKAVSKDVPRKSILKKSARNSSMALSDPQSPVPQFNGNLPKLGSDVIRQNIFIVRGTEAFSCVVEKCRTPESKKRPAEDGDGQWKAKRITRLPDCITSRMLIQNSPRFVKGDQTNKTKQSLGCSPVRPVAVSMLAKTGEISESAVIPVPGEPASPEEGSVIKEADAVSVSKEVTGTPSQVQKPHFICGDCKKKKVVLQPFNIGSDFTIFMCPEDDCVYPLGEDHLYRFLYRNLPNNIPRACTPTEAPTLDDIVAVLSSRR